MTKKITNPDTASLWEWVKAISTLVLVSVVAYKAYVTPMELKVDFPSLLSLLLALFSVALAALFYFKATETSNTFYDNTYNFTKDVAQLLAKMESGFGEKLRSLDEGYSSMRDYLQNSAHSSSIDETKQKIEGEKEEIGKVIEERNSIIRDLLEKSQLQEEEKKQVIAQLAEKEAELESSQRELSRMNKRLFIERMRQKDERSDSGLENFTESFLVNRIGRDKIMIWRPAALRRRIDEHLAEAPRQYIEDLERHGYFDDGITTEGIEFLRRLAKRSL